MAFLTAAGIFSIGFIFYPCRNYKIASYGAAYRCLFKLVNNNSTTMKGSLAIKYRPAPFCFQSRESIILSNLIDRVLQKSNKMIVIPALSLPP
jgi:hypothetical protein